MKQESIPDTLLKSGEFSKAPGRAEGLKAGDSILFCRDGKAGAPTLPSPERRQHPGAGPEGLAGFLVYSRPGSCQRFPLDLGRDRRPPLPHLKLQKTGVVITTGGVRNRRTLSEPSGHSLSGRIREPLPAEPWGVSSRPPPWFAPPTQDFFLRTLRPPPHLKYATSAPASHTR